VADRIVQTINEPCVIEGKNVIPGSSVGVALNAPNDNADAMLRNADLAMYRAKKNGRNRYEIYQQEIHAP
jgi:GGDEF domain-containing protein